MLKLLKMFRSRRLLKKDRSKSKLKFIFIFFVAVLLILIGAEFLYFKFNKVTLISPLAIIKTSSLAALENTLQKQQIHFSTVIVNNDGSYTVKLTDGGEVILSSKKDIGSQLSSLQLMLSRLTIEGKKLKILDFRFDNPVVSF